MFTSVRTERLLLRPFEDADVEGFIERRNNPRMIDEETEARKELT